MEAKQAKEILVIGIGTEIAKLLNEVYGFFERRPEIDYVPLVKAIDGTEREKLRIKVVTFGEGKTPEGERPVLYGMLIKDVEESKEKILKEIREDYNIRDVLLIANIGGGTGSVVLTRLSSWLKELEMNVYVICIIPSPRVSTYRPILTDNVIPCYRRLREMLGIEVKSIIYMDRSVFERYDDFNTKFKDLLIDMLLINKGRAFFSELRGEHILGHARIEFRYKILSKDFEILMADGCNKTNKGFEITDVFVPAKSESTEGTKQCLYFLRSENTKRRLGKRGLEVRMADEFYDKFGVVKDNNKHGAKGDENVVECDWIYNNSVEFLMVFKDLKGYAPLERILKGSAEYQPGKEVEVEMKFKYREEAIENLLSVKSVKASKIGTLKQKDIYFDVGEGNQLRLRRDESGCRITFKRVKSTHPLTRQEIDVVIGNLEDFEMLIEGLGYKEKAIIEKEREEFLVYYKDEEYIISSDLVKNLGRFVEIRKNVSEGYESETLENMRELAKSIDLDEEVTKSYLKLKMGDCEDD